MNNPTGSNADLRVYGSGRLPTSVPNAQKRPIDEWEECPVCQGTEGHYDGDEWVDCPHCQGQGGWSK